MKKNKSGKIAIFQISLLMISMFAFAFLIGGMSKVSAATTSPTSCTYTENNKVYSGTCLDINDCLGNYAIISANSPNVIGCTKSVNIGCCYDISTGTSCGNGVCELVEGETIYSCEKDCYCGSGVCDKGENNGNCPEDCPKTTTTEQKTDILPTITTAAGLASQTKGLIDSKETKTGTDEKSSLTNPSNAKGGSTLESASGASGIVGTAMGKLGISTYGKGTYIKTASGKYFATSGTSLTEGSAITDTIGGETITGTVVTSSGIGYSLAGIIKGATWGALVNIGITWIGGELDPDNADLWDDVGTSVGWGIFAGQAAFSLLSEGGALSGFGAAIGFGPWGAVAVGAATAVIIFLSIYDETRTETVTFTCYPWAAPTGGENCEACNDQGDIPCTEYQCKSLGQACELINKEETGEPICYWKDPKDVTPPIMKPLESALLADFSYTPDNTISPPDKGVRVVYGTAQNTCLPAFTPIAFGVETDEASRCKIDIRRTEDFDSMMSYVGDDASFGFEHTQTIVLPGPDTSGNLTLSNGGENSLYIRCQDPNGNFDLATFVFKYCVYDGPDTTPPMIVTTSLLNGGPIAFNQSSVDLTVYVNEPADCKWDYLDKSYDEMNKEMDCVTNPTQFNAQMLYECDTTLSGLISNKENKFYFRCQDQPLAADQSDRNKNMQSYVFKLQGTLPLQIDSVKPNGTIDGPTDNIKVTLDVKTSAGFKEGISLCGYKEEGEIGYTDFFNTNSYTHTQDLWLEEGDYNYSIMCVDLGGNVDYANAVFSVETDLASPIIVRAYYEDGYMKLITSEEAICVYGTSDCNYAFEDGVEIQSYEEKNHFVEWNTEEDLYVKCQDAYENQPTPQKECSMVVRASEYYEKEE
jgi:hypothetical protein